MISPRPLRGLIPLTELRSRVEEEASLLLPDEVVKNENVLFDHDGDGVVIRAGADRLPHQFTDWSRSQLLSHMGVKERWFGGQPLEDQAGELNRRLPLLANFKVRVLGADQDRVIRGLVSGHYSELADLDVMRALEQAVPDGQVIARSSESSQRALYVSLVSTSNPLRIHNNELWGYPGVLVRNSEVGYTSLWTVPFVWRPGDRRSMVMKVPLLRRAHRGKIDLEELLDKALTEATKWYGSIEMKLHSLRTITYPDLDIAAASLQSLILSSKGSGRMAQQCLELFRTKYSGLTAEHLLNAIMAYIDSEDDPDAAHDRSVVAGGVLMALIS